MHTCKKALPIRTGVNNGAKTLLMRTEVNHRVEFKALPIRTGGNNGAKTLLMRTEVNHRVEFEPLKTYRRIGVIGMCCKMSDLNNGFTKNQFTPAGGLLQLSPSAMANWCNCVCTPTVHTHAHHQCQQRFPHDQPVS